MRIRSVLNLTFAAAFFALLSGSSLLAQQKAAAPSPTRPKIRTITAFLNLDRTQYQQQIADALQMLRRAKTIFESRGYEVQTIRIATQPFSEYTKGLTPQQTIAFFKNLDALAEKEKFAPGIGPAMLNADDPESQADLLADILANTKHIRGSIVIAGEDGVRWRAIGATARARLSSPPHTSTASAINSPSASNPPTS